MHGDEDETVTDEAPCESSSQRAPDECRSEATCSSLDVVARGEEGGGEADAEGRGEGARPVLEDYASGADVAAEGKRFGVLTEEIDGFLKEKRQAIDASNVEEFIDVGSPLGHGLWSARLNARQLSQETHIRATVVDNHEGPLSRSVGTTSGKLVSPHGGSMPSYDVALRDREHFGTFNALEERLRNVETHLGIVVAPIDRSLTERVKVLEDKILKIEQYYPQIAVHVFNYGQAEVDASSRPGGRVSRVPNAPSGGTKRRAREDASLGTQRQAGRPLQMYDDCSEEADYCKGPDDEEGAAADGSSLGDLKRRMSELKQRLMNHNA